MATDERFDELISGWLEETAPQRLPERVLTPPSSGHVERGNRLAGVPSWGDFRCRG